jgi:hypothetical protein
MYQLSNLQTPPDKLTEYLQAGLDKTGTRFRRRAVLARSVGNGDWLPVCCTVEAFPNPKLIPEAVATRRYPQAVLFEDWLSRDECRKFVADVQSGQITIGGVCIERKQNPSWRMDLLPLKNNYMPRAGWVASSRFDWSTGRPVQEPLLSPSEPYYPDLNEAARDWLPLITYHGESDGRNYEVIFLVPESRAFFMDADYKDGLLETAIGGSEAKELQLMLKGAYWENASIKHFQSDVKGGKAAVHVPEDVDRLEYVLMDANGLIYDYQREDRFNHSGLGRKRPGNATANFVQRVTAACLEGEGTQAEFKPFIDCEQGMGNKTTKTKFRELITTIVAFANTQGGRIYIGVDDDCDISGVTPELERWAKAQVSEDVISRYRGVLTGRIRDQIIGDVPMNVLSGYIADDLVLIVEVSESASKPAMVRGDNIFYVRAGASNKQLPPDQWQSVLGLNNSNAALLLNSAR